MLGHVVFHVLSEEKKWKVFGVNRSVNSKNLFPGKLARRLISGIDLTNRDSLCKTFEKVKPDLVINCVSLSKTLRNLNSPVDFIQTYALLPHQISLCCKNFGARLISISTDGVFSGKKGKYTESDLPDANDLYGVTKLLGEVNNQHSVIIRTSIIGPELFDGNGLLSWFLSQDKICNGYRKVMFSGLPTILLAQIIRDYIIPNPHIFGLYHVAAESISKFDLLQLIAKIYGKSISIIPIDNPIFDRSLDSKKFQLATNYVIPSWPKLIKTMHEYKFQDC